MFSYREFADGSHNYRRRVERDDDRDYEVARSEDEAALITVSRADDPRQLAMIFTHFDNLLDAVATRKTTSVMSFADCQKLSTLFTYFKSISQQCDLAITKMDDIYQSIVIDYSFSTGGLIYLMEPEQFYSGMPSVRSKVPITSTLGKNRTITHEAFVALVALNPLRRIIPSFSYVFSYWQCGQLIDANKTTLSGLCDTEGTRPVMVYESNPGAMPLTRRLQQARDVMELKSILSYLLQIMGALDMAHAYADYTHYDLHSGNVLVQDLSATIQIPFQEYDLATRERVIIIDNGMAHCMYERPNQLAPLRKSSPRYSNADSVEIFSQPSGTAAIERLQASRIVNYGSIQNRVIGVHWNRSYPLADVFRIFFDIYSLCSVNLQRELKPLVSHFFTDENIERRLSGTVDHTSSMVNNFSLPPFRENLYKYKYSDFSRAILYHYGPRLKSFVRQRSMPLTVIPGLKLRDIFDWRAINPDFIPNLYSIGITSCLDEGVTTELSRRELREPMHRVLKQHYHLQEFLVRLLADSQWKSVSRTDDLLNETFYREYTNNLRRCVDHVQWVRIIYSNTRVLHTALTVLRVEFPLEVLAATLEVEKSDLSSLASYCQKKSLPKRTKEIFIEMMDITDSVQALISKMLVPRTMTWENHRINWYRACLPGIRNHLEFGMAWGQPEAQFGELSLPDILKRC